MTPYGQNNDRMTETHENTVQWIPIWWNSWCSILLQICHMTSLLHNHTFIVTHQLIRNLLQCTTVKMRSILEYILQRNEWNFKCLQKSDRCCINTGAKVLKPTHLCNVARRKDWQDSVFGLQWNTRFHMEPNSTERRGRQKAWNGIMYKIHNSKKKSPYQL